nr:PD40 domain-containing protein [Acidobacteriota bacterium]
MHSRQSRFAALFVFVLTLALSPLVKSVRSESDAPRRVTRAPAETLSLNPSISGDGRRLAFESNSSPAGVRGPVVFRLFGVDVEDIDNATPSFERLADSRAPAPSLSQDGTRVAFASKDDPAGRNRDGNSEIFYLDAGSLRQLTETLPDDTAGRAGDGSFQPSISDDGELVAFSSNRDLTGANPDHSFEIFTYHKRTLKFTQLTDTSEATVATAAKISGDGSRVAFIRAQAQGAASARLSDLVIHERSSGTSHVAVNGVAGLAFTYGRAISDDGLRVVYAADTATNTSQVFLYDGRNGLVRQITRLGARASDVPLHPTISGDGNRLAFATRRNVNGGNSDASVELYLYDISADRFERITSAPPTATREVVSSLNDEGTLVAFSFPRVLADPVTSEAFVNNPEIFLAGLTPRTPFASGLQAYNAAARNKLPSTPGLVAPDSLVNADGLNLALSAIEAPPPLSGSLPTRLQNTTVTVNGLSAQIYYVSPTQLNFLIPHGVGSGPAEIAVRNHDGFETRGAVNVARAAPGIFTEGGGGTGRAIALDAETLRAGPFDATDDEGGPRRLIVFGTGLRHASEVSASIGGRAATIEAVVASPDLPGLDQIHIVLSSRLKGAGTVPLVIRADGFESNRATLDIAGGGASPKPTRLVLSPPSATIPVGGEVRFVAQAFDSNDEEIVSPSVTFVSGDSSVATVDTGGLAVARAEGTTTILAAFGNVSASGVLRVVA